MEIHPGIHDSRLKRLARDLVGNDMHPETRQANCVEELVEPLPLIEERVVFNQEMMDAVQAIGAVQEDIDLSPLDVDLE